MADCRLDFGLDAAQTRVLAVFMLVLGLMLCINPMLFFCQVRDMCKADKVVAPFTTPLLCGVVAADLLSCRSASVDVTSSTRCWLAWVAPRVGTHLMRRVLSALTRTMSGQRVSAVRGAGVSCTMSRFVANPRHGPCCTWTRCFTVRAVVRVVPP